MSEQNSLLVTANRATLLGNRISLKMVQFLNEVKNQPAGFRDLGLDFLGICQILNSLEESLKEHFRSNQPFPQQAIPELTRILAKTLDDFSHLEALLQKFMDFERGGTFAMLQKTWRIVFADKDIAVIGGSLQESRGALKMTMLLTNINPTPNNVPVGYEYAMLATKLEHQGSGSPVQNRPMAPPPPASPTVSELHGYEVPRPLPGPPSGPPPNWHQSQPPLPQRKAVAESVSTMSSQDPESPASQGILTPSISEMSISDRAPEPFIVSAIDTTEKEIPTPLVKEKIAVEEPQSSRDLQANQPSTQGPPRIHIDRSTLQFRIPKQTSGAKNASLKSALVSAVTAQKSKIVEQLLDRGVSPDTGPEKNVLCIAAYENDPESLKLLLVFGGNPNLKGADGQPPLRWACQHNYPAVARLLLEFGADSNISTPNYSVLPWALDDNKEEIVRDLLLYGADPNLVMTNGVISLRYACDRDVKPSLVQDLLNYGADPNLKDARGETSLPLACAENKVEIVKVLLASGADPNLKGQNLPIKCALRSPECMRLLISAGVDFKLSKGLMELAVDYNAIDTIRLMLDAGVDPNEKMSDYYTPLSTSIRENHPEIMSLLLSRGADPNAPGEGLPLINASTFADPQRLRILLDAGADVNRKNDKGHTALMTACENGHMENVTLLIERGADVDLADNGGKTAMDFAAAGGHDEVVMLLLDTMG